MRFQKEVRGRYLFFVHSVDQIKGCLIRGVIFGKKTQSTMKNRNNDRSDASLQVNHLGDVHGSRSGARPPIREAITKKYTYPPDRAPWLVTKTHLPLRIIKKTLEHFFCSGET